MDIVISVVLLLLGIPVIFFFLECLLGIIPVSKKNLPPEKNNATTAILMPAHNEEAVIAHTLSNLTQHITDSDCVVVVADNCNDETASIVEKFGFTTLERHHATLRGKGYALDFGMQYLKSLETPPDIVVILDADCLLETDALAHLKHAVSESGRPAQACYLMKRGEIDRMGVKVSEFAFLVKNKIRLRGLAKLGMPVPLTGTGMAFPWPALASASLATGDIVEDMRLGVELAEKGAGAGYCDHANVISYFPTSEAAEKTQRERWEHGHLSTLRAFVPRLFKRAVSAPSKEALGMMLDLVIPPLSLLVMMISGLFFISVVYGFVSSTWWFSQLSGLYLTMLTFIILLTWACYGRHILSLKALLHIPFYAVSKIVIYIGYIVRKQTKWIRTDRH